MFSRIVDADGHVRERDEVLCDYLEGRYKGKLHDPTHRFFPSISPSTFGLRDPAVHDVVRAAHPRRRPGGRDRRARAQPRALEALI